jgi:hypothetical protein
MDTHTRQTGKTSPRQLPTFRGYTVDERLREFRKVTYGNLNIEFVSFDSELGRQLLNSYFQK